MKWIHEIGLYNGENPTMVFFYFEILVSAQSTKLDALAVSIKFWGPGTLKNGVGLYYALRNKKNLLFWL